MVGSRVIGYKFRISADDVVHRVAVAMVSMAIEQPGGRCWWLTGLDTAADMISQFGLADDPDALQHRSHGL
jgi:hypothetical protein